MFLEEFQHNSQRISGGSIWLWKKVISMQNLCRARLSTAIWIQFNEGPVEDKKNGGPVIEGHLKAKVITKIWMCQWPPWSCVPQALQMIKSVCMLNKLFPEKEKKFFRRQAWQVKVRSYPKITLSCAFYLSPQVCKAFVKFRNFFLVLSFPLFLLNDKSWKIRQRIFHPEHE